MFSSKFNTKIAKHFASGYVAPIFRLNSLQIKSRRLKTRSFPREKAIQESEIVTENLLNGSDFCEFNIRRSVAKIS